MLSAAAGCEVTSKVNPFLQMISLQSQYVMKGLGEKMLVIAVHKIQSVLFDNTAFTTENHLTCVFFLLSEGMTQKFPSFLLKSNIGLILSATCTNSHVFIDLKWIVFC